MSEMALIALRIRRSMGFILRFIVEQWAALPEETKSRTRNASSILRKLQSCRPDVETKIEFSRKGWKSRLSNFTIHLFSL